MITLITGVSASWKTTLADYLVENYWYKKLINFTTREMRTEKELDDYVFLTEEKFIKKLLNWDFFEFTVYNWNFYWIWWIDIDNINWDYIAIVEPIWRAQFVSKLNLLWIKYRLVYLELDKAWQLRRLEERRSSIKEIKERQKDYLAFYPTGFNNEIIFNTEDNGVKEIWERLSGLNRIWK